jgi:hypothetical protein
MQLEGLKQPPFNTTLLGVVKGALDYYGIVVSPAWAFGGSGHAFLINIHKELCPSGPYCWKYDGFYPLVRNLGLEMVDLGFFHKGSAPEERAALEKELRGLLDSGQPCSFVNMENQLICGYDDKALLLCRPWDCGAEITPERLSFGSWQEFGDELHVNFFALRRARPQDAITVIRDSLRYAIELSLDRGKYAEPDYGVGPDAYDNWVAAAEKHGASHGNWWNGTVWAECRKMAAAYFTEIAAKLPDVAAQAKELAAAYQLIAAQLEKIADKELDVAAKKRIALDLKQKELDAVGQIGRLLPRLGA